MEKTKINLIECNCNNMTQRQKLDKILYGLMSRLPKRYADGTDNKNLTFEFLCSVLLKDENVEPWEVNSLKGFLIEDGYIEMVDAEDSLIPNITHKGKKFLLDGGYEKEQKRKELQDELVETGVKSNKRSKWALWTSAISLVVAILALVFQIIKA